jgi:hypothetical protein
MEGIPTNTPSQELEPQNSEVQTPEIVNPLEHANEEVKNAYGYVENRLQYIAHQKALPQTEETLANIKRTEEMMAKSVETLRQAGIPLPEIAQLSPTGIPETNQKTESIPASVMEVSFNIREHSLTEADLKTITKDMNQEDIPYMRNLLSNLQAMCAADDQRYALEMPTGTGVRLQEKKMAYNFQKASLTRTVDDAKKGINHAIDSLSKRGIHITLREKEDGEIKNNKLDDLAYYGNVIINIETRK